jgi:hypothetical protein
MQRAARKFPPRATSVAPSLFFVFIAFPFEAIAPSPQGFARPCRSFNDSNLWARFVAQLMSINGARGNRLPCIRTSLRFVFHATCGFCLQPEGKIAG